MYLNIHVLAQIFDLSQISISSKTRTFCKFALFRIMYFLFFKSKSYTCYNNTPLKNYSFLVVANVKEIVPPCLYLYTSISLLNDSVVFNIFIVFHVKNMDMFKLNSLYFLQDMHVQNIINELLMFKTKDN